LAKSVTFKLSFKNATVHVEELEVPVESLVTVEYVELQDPPDIHEPVSGRAVLQHHWWRGKVKPIRAGPSTEHWDLRIEWHPKKPLIHFILYENPLWVNETPCKYSPCENHSWMEKGKDGPEYLKPGTPGNPTKNTPAYIEIVDEGTARIYESSDMFVKLDLRMKKLKGHFVIVRRDPRLNLWDFRREESSPPVRKR